jgi:CubicO group peptidase (beta-lactamase class C family)
MVEHPLPATAATIQRGIDAGLHSGAQVYAYAGDGRRFSAVLGDDGGSGPMMAGVLMPIFCAARPLLAFAVARLVAAGRLSFDTTVASFVPEFGHGGKEGVTVGQVLTHTSGINEDPAARLRGHPWDVIVKAICETPVERGWAPGTHASYQLFSYWYVIGELIMRVCDEPLGVHLHREVIRPLGLRDTWVGMTEETFAANLGRLGHVTEGGGFAPAELETRHFCCGHLPFSPRATARDLASFYRALIAPGSLEHVLPADLVRALRTPSRVGMHDHGWALGGGQVDWAPIGMVESRRYGRVAQLFGRHSSDAAFGHFGHRAAVGFADPEHGVAAAFTVTGMPDAVPAHLRTQAICTALYRDMSIV